MAYIPTIVVDDDDPEVRKYFRLKSKLSNVKVVDFESWDKTKSYLDSGQVADAVVLDAKGQLTADSTPGEEHILESLASVKALQIPYAIYTAYTDSMGMLKQQIQEGRVFTKGQHKEEDVFEFLKEEIRKSPKVKIINQYPEPFACFADLYLDVKYLDLLVDIIQILENDGLKNAESMLFNPCRIILERVFEKVNEVDEKVLPYALMSFKRPRAGLLNCFKHMSGIPYYLNNVKQYPISYFRNNEYEYISKQMDIIITTCHPSSHDIQKRYSAYTFQSVLTALFDVLIWLKVFVDERN